MSITGYIEGRCACGGVHFRLTKAPIFVEACHCHDCQRLSGAPFSLRGWIEEDAVELTAGIPTSHTLPSGSGADHDLIACAECGSPLWSWYHNMPEGVVAVHAGTLADLAVMTPQAHIFTRSKQPWLELPEDTPSFETRYAIEDVWPSGAVSRVGVALSRVHQRAYLEARDAA